MPSPEASARHADDAAAAARDHAALLAIRHMLRESHTSRSDGLPALLRSAAAILGCTDAAMYVVDYDQVVLVAFRGAGDDPAALSIDGTIAGRAFREVATQVRPAEDGSVVWVPMLDGADRLGVVHFTLPAGVPADAELLQTFEDIAGLLAEAVVTHSRYGDAIERARRQVPLTLPAELQWHLLPPLTFVSRRVSIAGVLAPSTEVAGDSFDFSVDADTAHVAIIDAMGHGLEATLMAAVAMAALRNGRRGGLELEELVPLVDRTLATTFGPDKFVTGIFGRLDTAAGVWTWTTCGHPPALLVRGGRVVKQLDAIIAPPLGVGLLGEDVRFASERLERRDRLLLYSDGVTEARDASGEFFGTERLVDFVVKQSAAGMPTAETLRRLNHEILHYQEGALQDDATTVMVEWQTEEPELVFGDAPPPGRGSLPADH